MTIISNTPAISAPNLQHPSFREAFGTWLRIGVLSFGGPAAQIALMHRIIVDEKKWLPEEQYLSALSFCMLLPGPEAMQLATYAGWRLHGLKGGLAAGLLFVLPGAAVVLALAVIYAAFGNVPLVQAIFFGVKAAVLVIVIEALLRIGKRALKLSEHWFIAGLSFIAIFFLGLPFPLIVFSAALFGFIRTSRSLSPQTQQPTISVNFLETARTAAVWIAIWIAPLIAIAAAFGRNSVPAQLGWFFSKLAVVTFGGAYAVLAYMGQDVALRYHWLDAGQMMDGLGLAETTPGPLILVTEFVGFLAAFQHGVGQPWLLGLLGAVIALWATFAPCFLWIFTGAPYIEWIVAQPRLKGALAAITAAVVGVILNLTLWFALHVFFGEVTFLTFGPFQIWMPTLTTLDWRVLLLAGISVILLLRQHWNIAAVLAVVSGLALVLRIGGI